MQKILKYQIGKTSVKCSKKFVQNLAIWGDRVSRRQRQKKNYNERETGGMKEKDREPERIILKIPIQVKIREKKSEKQRLTKRARKRGKVPIQIKIMWKREKKRERLKKESQRKSNRESEKKSQSSKSNSMKEKARETGICATSLCKLVNLIAETLCHILYTYGPWKLLTNYYRPR